MRQRAGSPSKYNYRNKYITNGNITTRKCRRIDSRRGTNTWVQPKKAPNKVHGNSVVHDKISASSDTVGELAYSFAIYSLYG